MAFCPNDTNEQSALGFQYVTQLEQYTYLLRVALSRLYNLLRRKGNFIGLKILVEIIL